MATVAVATAAGMAMLLYFIINRRLLLVRGAEDPLKPCRSPVRRRISRRPAQAPATWREAAATLAETLRFTYSETLGKWPVGDLAFGIKYLMRRQGNLQVSSVYAGSNCVELKGPEITAELIHLLRLLNLCMLFSKKPFPVFLESAGYSHEDVLLQEPKAGLLKPAFTIICDKESRCFLLLIRGTHSIKDTLTAATGAVVPFHHSVLHEGGISQLVLGYAHCGMVAAARCIAKCTTPCLLKAVSEYPDFKIKVVGHSLGGGTAALLTYILRERIEFSSSTCVAFAPAACMTWDLAESGKHFISAVVNGCDLVPTFSTASIDSLRSEVTASSWLNDLREQVQHTKILNVVYRSASALGSHLPSFSSATARVAGAGAILSTVSSKTQVVVRNAQIWNRPSFSSWSCMGARRRVLTSPKKNDLHDTSSIASRDSISFMTEDTEISEAELDFGCYRGSDHEETEDEALIPREPPVHGSKEEEMTEDELWTELQKELHEDNSDEADMEVREEEAAAAKEITEEENEVLQQAAESMQPITSETLETHQFYPPGRIMHMVVIPASDPELGVTVVGEEGGVGIYETPRELYSKIRLSSTMINDHYMPMYRKMMELLIAKLGREDDACTNTHM